MCGGPKFTVLRDAFRDADGERDLSLEGLLDTGSGQRWAGIFLR